MNERHAHLTALRGVAATGVALSHMLFLPEPDLALPAQVARYVAELTLGVPLFYILSAYTLCLSAEGRVDEPSASKRFYLRRFFRIAPLFYVMTAVYLFVHGPVAPSTLIANLTFTFNFFPRDRVYEGIVWAGWSIGVEMAFYAVFPILFRRARSLDRAVALTTIFLFCSWGFRRALIWASEGGHLASGIPRPDWVHSYGTLALLPNLPYFGFGFVAYHLARALRPAAEDRPPIGRALLLFAATGCVSIPYFQDSHVEPLVPLRHLLSVSFVCLILGAGWASPRWLVNRFTVFVGERSFSIYLVHCLVIWELRDVLPRIYLQGLPDVVAFAACAVLVVSVTLAVSYLTHRFVEEPGQKLGRWVERRWLEHRPAGGSGAAAPVTE